MIVTADEVSRSLRGAAELMNRRVEGLKSFDMSEEGFWRSFGALWLTLPALIVFVALERRRLGLDGGGLVLAADWLTVTVVCGHLASFLALPVAMIWGTRRLGVQSRYVPFVIVSNWLLALGTIALSVPAILLLVGWATPSLARCFALAFAVIIWRVQWFATKVTLGVSGGLAAAVVGLGIALYGLIAGAVDILAG